MSAPRFFVPLTLAPALVGTAIRLPEQAAHHATRVLRLPQGAAMTLFDGKGGEYAATLLRVDKREATARLEAFAPIERESPLAVTLVQAVIAADAMDYAVRKATELGVAAIAPLVAARSQGVLSGERADKRHVHWRQIAIAACEQCGRNRLPSLEPTVTFDGWLRGYDAAHGVAVIAGPGTGESLASRAARAPPRYVLIGPEGGFTDAEVARAHARGVLPVHLGPRVLRAETAGVAALAMLQAIAGDAR